MASPEGNSGPKPFELHNVIHAPNQGGQLQGLEANARSKLQELPPHQRIVLFTEYGGHSTQVSRLATLYVLRGQTPREAIETAAAQFAERISRRRSGMVDPEEVAREREAIKKAYSRGFLGSETDMVTRLTEEFPGRVLWLPEGTTLETRAILGESHSFEARNMWLSMLPFERRGVRTSRRRLDMMYWATTHRLREGTISDEIEGLMAHPDTAAGFGSIGSSHRGLPDELRERGLDVTVQDAYRKEGEVAHDLPTTILINRIRMDPEATVTDAEINAAYTAELDTTLTMMFGKLPFVGSISRLVTGMSEAERERKGTIARGNRAHRIFERRLARRARKSETGKSPAKKARKPRFEDTVAQELLDEALRAKAESTTAEQTTSSQDAHPSLDDTMPDNPLDQTDVPLSERNSDRDTTPGEVKKRRNSK